MTIMEASYMHQEELNYAFDSLISYVVILKWDHKFPSPERAAVPIYNLQSKYWEIEGQNDKKLSIRWDFIFTLFPLLWWVM